MYTHICNRIFCLVFNKRKWWGLFNHISSCVTTFNIQLELTEDGSKKPVEHKRRKGWYHYWIKSWKKFLILNTLNDFPFSLPLEWERGRRKVRRGRRKRRKQNMRRSTEAMFWFMNTNLTISPNLFFMLNFLCGVFYSFLRINATCNVYVVDV